MSHARKPDWLKMRPPSGQEFTGIKRTLREYGLHTVCEEANCPNLGECWSGRSNAPEDSGFSGARSGDAASRTSPNDETVGAVEGGRSGGAGTATFMLMGDRCSRGCNFCDVATGGMEALDPDEPANVAAAIAEIGLDYVVLTSVDRDDLPDGGAGHFAETIREIKARHPGILVEVLIPDFQGEPAQVRKIIDAEPDVIAHNIETVERLQFPVRDRRANYEQSLRVLEQVSRESGIYTKTSIMLGLGERDHEVYQTLSDLHESDVNIVTLGQYLQPSRSHLDVFEYVHPDKFETWWRVAEDDLGYLYCASGPMVRSSYKAGELFVDAILRDGKSVERAREEVRAAMNAGV